jgi:membrane protease YdiL (CAAX protease family)
MTDPEPGAPALGPPARPPGPVPAGFVPREWLQQQPPPAPAPQPPSLPTAPWSPADAPPDRLPDVPFLDTPWVPPKTPRQAWYWLLFAVGGFVVGQLAAGVFAVVAGALAGKTVTQTEALATQTVPPEWYVVSTLIGLWIGFLGAPWLASRTQGTRHFARDLGLRFRWIDLIGIVIGLGGQYVIDGGYWLYQHLFHHTFNNFNAPSQKLTGASHGTGFVVIAIATVLLAPAAEELFFRGLLLKSLVRLFTPLQAAGRTRAVTVVLAVVADGLLFGAAHGEWVQFAGLAGFGIVLAAVSYRTGRLGMNMVAHATFNLVAIVSIALNGSVILFR